MDITLEREHFLILCVDDETAVLDAIVNDLREEYGDNYDIEGAKSADEGMAMIEVLKQESREIALVIADQRMPGIEGVEFLSEVKDNYPDARRALLTGYADKKNAIDSINKAGVHNYFVKPWARFKDEIYRAIDKLLLDFTVSRMEKIELVSAKQSIQNIFKLALLSEQRDKKIRGHSIRVAIYSYYIGKQRNLSEEQLLELCEHAFIHDIGMIGTGSMKFKNNPGKLEDEYLNPEESLDHHYLSLQLYYHLLF